MLKTKILSTFLTLFFFANTAFTQIGEDCLDFLQFDECEETYDPTVLVTCEGLTGIIFTLNGGDFVNCSTGQSEGPQKFIWRPKGIPTGPFFPDWCIEWDDVTEEREICYTLISGFIIEEFCTTIEACEEGDEECTCENPIISGSFCAEYGSSDYYQLSPNPALCGGTVTWSLSPSNAGTIANPNAITALVHWTRNTKIAGAILSAEIEVCGEIFYVSKYISLSRKCGWGALQDGENIIGSATVFPNPVVVGESFTINLKKDNTENRFVTAKIFNQNGLLQKSINFDFIGEEVRSQIETSDLSPGIHFIKIGDSRIEKFVILE